MNRRPGLYVHIPFCPQKCSYCDFLSFPAGACEMERYTSALIREIEERGGTPISTVFFGGGTPTFLPVSCLEDIMAAVKKNFSLEDAAEVSIESNPETVDFEKLSAIREMGVNRLSFGVQSLDDRILKRINRAHNREKALESFESARMAGFDNINLDLMFSLPGQSFEDFKKSLQEAVSLSPEHISCYSLILAEGTPLFRENPALPDEETDRAMYHYAVDFLEKNGYRQYEISNFAKPGRLCRHNAQYWDLTPYLGLGLGASSFVDNTRWSNTTDFDEYINGGRGRFEEVFVGDAMREYMFLKFRMTEGVVFSDFFEMFGVYADEYFKDELESLVKRGLLEMSERAVFLTRYGMDLANIVFEKFL